MKVSLNWVKEYTDIKLSVDELVEKIGAQLGAVEEVINLGERYQVIVVAKVIECVNHPNADKLSLCKIDDNKLVEGVKRDDNGYVQVVCGAPNVKAGMLVAWLPPGTVVPSTFEGDQLKLEVRDIRGQASNGMLASAHELGISEDHSGIVELHPLDAEPGDDFAQTYKLDDYIIDIENKMFTHRPDCFGILGVARELAGITHKPFESPSWYKTPVKLSRDGPALPLKVSNPLPKLVPRFTTVAIRVGHNGPSPLWLQTYLSRVGLRPINTVVDITNYFMYLTGQPLHAYDYDKLAELGNGSVSLETRLSKKGEKLTLLGGKEVTFADNETILITSQNKPVGIGGVMGGAGTEVDENTTKIVLECANFDMYTLRRSAMRYGLFTDAVTRFNKGQSSLQQDRVLARAAQDMVKLTQGSIASEVIDKHAALDQPKPVRVAPSFINERLGLSLSPKKMAELLQNVEFKVMTAAGKQLAVTPPFWRTDIAIAEDIVEEVGRLYGYDHVPLELQRRDITPASKNPMLELQSRVRTALAKSGANEVLTYSFLHGDHIQKAGQDPKHAFRLSNALSPDLQYYRLSLTPSLLDLIHPNIKAGYDEFALFEIGKVHYKGEWDAQEPEVPQEYTQIALVFAADDKISKQQYAGAPFYAARRYLDLIVPVDDFTFVPLEAFDFGKHNWTKQTSLPFEPTRAALLVKNDQAFGVFGEFREDVKRAFKLPAFTAGFEIFSQAVKPNSAAYTPLPRFPKIEQDITLKVPTEVSYSQLFSLLWDKLGELKPENTLANLTPLDIYQKDEAHKHLTWRLSIASYERTLTDVEVNGLLDKVALAAAPHGAERI